MKLVSLGSGRSTVGFEQALKRGLAPDKSLYFPKDIPKLTKNDLKKLCGADRKQVAKIVLSKWLRGEVTPKHLAGIIDRASTFPTPLKKVGDKYVLELFHGPTMAFKDVAARYLAEFVGHFSREGEESTVIVATSGDTGGAIAHGFGGVKGVRVVVLFPKHRVSELQYEQLTRVDGNVTAVEVEGTFDDCARLVKKVLSDKILAKKLNFTSANSINFGRVLPQMTYYAYIYAQLCRDDIRVVVPTGNLGNLTAGVFSWRMGVPIQQFLCANNRNDSLVRYLKDGSMDPFASVNTMSNAMDIGLPNNLPRFDKLFGGDYKRARKQVSATSIDDQLTRATIKNVFETYGYLLDPHTAVAWAASERIQHDGADVIVATAAPEKFSTEIYNATGIKVSNQKEMQELQQTSRRVQTISPHYEDLKGILELT